VGRVPERKSPVLLSVTFDSPSCQISVFSLYEYEPKRVPLTPVGLFCPLTDFSLPWCPAMPRGGPLTSCWTPLSSFFLLQIFFFPCSKVASSVLFFPFSPRSASTSVLVPFRACFPPAWLFSISIFFFFSLWVPMPWPLWRFFVVRSLSVPYPLGSHIFYFSLFTFLFSRRLVLLNGSSRISG